MILDYTPIPGLNIWRPYLYGRLRNRSAGQFTLKLPMVIDTGSDRCLFDVELAHRIGINPVDGGNLAGTTGICGRIMTAFWPIEVEFPQLNRSFEIYAQFTNALPADVNGLLGNQGFLDRFSKVCFLPKCRQFSVEL